MDSSQANTSSEGKSALDSLDHEELIKRYKKLLGIAQHAKKSRDEMKIDFDKLKEKLTECDTQKQADKDCLKTMQMMVDSLTENKLDAANKISDLEKSVKNLNQQLQTSNGKLAQLEIENEAKDKQIQRLTNENDEQEMDLKRLDERLAKVSELSQRQTQELLLLEQSVDRWKAMESAHHKLQQENKELQAKLEAVQAELCNETTIAVSQHECIVKSLQSERDDNQRLYDETKSQLDALQMEFEQLKKTEPCDESEKIDVLKEQLQHENDQLKKQCDDQTYKLNKYKAKVCEFSSKLKEVKQSKKLLTDTVLDYSNSVTKWQVQISHASKLMIKEVNNLNETKIGLEKQLETNVNLVKDLRVTVDELENRLMDAGKCNENDDFKVKYETLLVEIETLQKEIQDKNAEIARYDDLTEKNVELGKQLESTANLVKDMKTTIGELESRLAEASNIREKYDTLFVENESLQKDIENKDTKIANFNSLSEAKIELENQLESSERLVKDLRVTIDELQNQLAEAAKSNESVDFKEKYENLQIEYESLQNEIRDKNLEIANYTSLNEIKVELEKQLESNECLVKDLRTTIDELEGRLVEASKINEKYESLLVENESLQKEIHDKNSEIASFNSLNEAKIELEKQLESSECLVKDLKTTIDDFELRLEAAVKNNETSEIKEKYEMLLIDYKSIQKDIEDKNIEIANLTQEFEQVCTSLKEEIENRSLAIQKLTEECQLKTHQISELQENETVANKKNADLLAEMRELNDVLKTRGEVISSKTAEIDQIKTQLNEQSKQIATLEESLKEKSKQIEQFRNQFDNQSEILSTSTISRADEVARMRDIEDSFEEKYNKLRALAVKLKKKTAEQQMAIAKFEAATPTTTEASTVSAAAQTQNLISLQKDNDRLLDQIDSMKSEQKQLKSEINQLNQQIKKADDEAKSLRIVNDDIKATSDANLKIKSALDEQIRSGEKQIETLKNENKNIVQQLKNAENEIIKLKDIVKQKESEITEKADEVSKIKSEMNKLKNSMKKSSVLKLEVEAYEKSLTEMSQKHETTLKQLSEAKSEVEAHQISIKKLTTDVQNLTNQLELEKQNSTEYQQQNELQRIKIKENGLEITELKRIIDDHVKETNHIKIELTNLQSQQSENEVEKQKFIAKLKSENESNVTKMLTLEEEVRDLRTKLSSCEQELANVQTDFASYKIRAQAVLRQNQSKDSSNEEELKEELTILTQAKEDLNKKLAHASEQQRHLENTIEELKGEKFNLQERCKKLLQLIDETRQQIETMQSENRKQTQEHHEALKMQRLQVETLNNCFKTQIEEMEKKHEEEIAAMKSASMQKGTVLGADPIDSTLSLAKGAQLTTEQRIELLMMERQDGEGSECTTSTHQRKISGAARGKHEVIPLDELLSNTFDEELENAELDEHEDKVVPKEKFEAQQSRVKHLSTLLSEAEMDVARLTEMNTMLKEELRRQERSTEREKQMQNLEYMKNVIFKFLTINNADERAHLVPVLNIILKLSPDESKTLQTVARGSDGGQSTWSNLLPMW